VSYHRAHYLEEYYWIGESLNLLKQTIPEPDSLVDYLGRCFTSKGGFNRSQHIGAPSIEYTHQAVHLIRLLEKKVGKLID
jgi:hypothetical protein